MRRIRYQCACSLDGFITGPDGDTAWLVDEPAIDFPALFDQFDTLLMGRLTYEDMLRRGGNIEGKRIVVVSSTLRAADHSDVTLLSGDLKSQVEALRAEDGKDIWLFGGGKLAGSLLALGLLDTIEPAVMPAVVGTGVRLLEPPAPLSRLKLTSQRSYPSGIVWLEYDVMPSP